MTPTVTNTVAQRAKHPCGRRNTLIHPYVRHGLGFSTAEWEESLTVKFRNLPSRERRLYTLSLGYGLRDNNNRGAHNNTSVKRKRRPEMTRDHALTLMARFHEMLLHGGRTVEGIFAALGIDARCGTLVYCDFMSLNIPGMTASICVLTSYTRYVAKWCSETA